MKLSLPLLTAILATSFVGCTGMSHQTSGTLGGAAIGAGLGAVAGNNIKGISKTEGAIAGGLVGGLIGNRMGAQQDQINNLNARSAPAYYGQPQPYYAPPPPPPPYYRGY